jgi:tRNA-dihydrouridine synthase
VAATTSIDVMTKLDELSPHPVMLAPMVGLTHYAVRDSLHDFLPEGARALWPTEMLNSRRIPSQLPNENPEIYFYDSANGLCPQLLANEEEFIRMSVPRLENWGAAAIDINMGCPVRKALKHNYGVALMGDPAYAAEVVRMTASRAKVPVSVKLRASGVPKDGEKHDFDYLLRFIGGLVDAGASWITLHPRSAEQGRKGSADWSVIARLKKELKIPIIGNGDVEVASDIDAMVEKSGCDRVMIGRALMAKPWLLSRKPGSTEPIPDNFEQHELYGRFMKGVVRRMKERYPIEAGLRRIRFLAVYSRPYVEFGEYLYGRTMAAKTYEDLEASFEKFFATKQRILDRTSLRV